MKSINDDWEYKVDNDDNDDDDEDEDEDLKPLIVRSSTSTSSSSVAAKPLEVLLSTSGSSKSSNNNVNTKLKGLQRKRKQQQQHSIYTLFLLLLLLLVVVVVVFVTVYDNNQIIMPTTKMKMNNKNENLKHDDDDDDATTKTTTTTTTTMMMMKQQQKTTTTTKKRISVGGGFCPDFDFDDEGFDNENNNNTTERTTTKVSLGFIHIRKTGGMAISSVGRQHNYGWGGKEHLQNSTLDIPNYSQATGGRTDIGNLGHIPPQFFIPYPFTQGQKTFVVIRNPYDRAISEYYQGIKWYMNMKEINPQFEISGRNSNFPKNFDDMNNPNNMNAIIQNNILYPSGDSFIPQHLYIYKFLLPTQQQEYPIVRRRLVDHVLRFENLKIEFDDLMDCYKLKNVTLPSQPVNGRQQTAILTTKNLTQETIHMINQYMKLDFELLNYTMIVGK